MAAGVMETHSLVVSTTTSRLDDALPLFWNEVMIWECDDLVDTLVLKRGTQESVVKQRNNSRFLST